MQKGFTFDKNDEILLTSMTTMRQTFWKLKVVEKE